MITKFKGKYEFLDPAYYCLAGYDGVIYNSAEAAFLASQYDAPNFRSMFRDTALPIWRARELAKRLQKRRDCTPELSLELMRQITLDKFSRSPNLRFLLLATRHERIVAENNWHEQFWGRCICNTRSGKYGRKDACLVPGGNHLGKILMSVRDHLAVEAQAVASLDCTPSQPGNMLAKLAAAYCQPAFSERIVGKQEVIRLRDGEISPAKSA